MAYPVVRNNETVVKTRSTQNVLFWSSTAIAVLCGVAQSAAQTLPIKTNEQITNQGTVRSFNIPAQPLSSALSAFNLQSGIQVTQVAGAVTPATKANAVRGKMTPQQALAKMLNGTGISFHFSSNRAAVIGTQKIAQHAPNPDGSTVLDTIVISGKSAGNSGYQGTPDWVYEKPASVSVVSRDAIQNNPATRNVADSLDSVAGVLTNRSESQKPGLSVNVRGLQDMNRITTSIDGARQNFQRAGHGSYQQVFVDKSFIRAVEVEKGAVTGVGGAGALGGMVNFRTIEADDIISPGKNWGAEINGGTGTNAYKFDGSVVGGVRLTENFSLIGGVSHKNLGDYKIGSRGDFEKSEVSEGRTVMDEKMLYSRNEALNTLLKADWQVNEDLNIQASWLRYEAEGRQGSDRRGSPQHDEEKYNNNTLTTVIAYDPNSELVNAKARFWFNDTGNDSLRVNNDEKVPVSYGMKSFGGSLENTSRFPLPVGELSLHYGAEAFHDEGLTETVGLDHPNDSDAHYGFAGMNPTGKRIMASGFANVTLQHEDWLTLTGGLRYDYYNVHGSTLVQDQRIIVTPAQGCLRWQDIDGDGADDPDGLWADTATGSLTTGPGPGIEFFTPTCEAPGKLGSREVVFERYPTDVDQSGGAWLPSTTIAVKPFDWIQPFVSYSRSYRPPAITESLISGGHPYVPFDHMPNPTLTPEKAELWELGVNISQNAILTEDDAFRLKAVYFHRNIKDFISMGMIWFEAADRTYTSYVNLDGTSRVRGYEIEASYDIGHAYLGASYARMNTDFASTYDRAVPSEYGDGEQLAKPAIMFVAPKNKLTLDAGVRLFDKQLIVGGRLNYVSNTEPTVGVLFGNYVTESYTVYDLYGSWAFNDMTKLRFGVTNLTNEKYTPSLGTYSYPAPGRTFTTALNVKF